MSLINFFGTASVKKLHKLSRNFPVNYSQGEKADLMG